MRVLALNICLWIAAITLAISVGGNLFQRTVLDPVWSTSPPDSVQAFSSETSLVAIRQGMKRFHQSPTFLFGLACLVASPLLAWNKRAMRNWLLIAAVIYIGIGLVTVLYFYPMNAVLGFLGARPSTDAATLIATTRRWIFADRIRFIFRVVSFLCVLRAMTLSGAAAIGH